jgi:hypothetical protein
MKSRIKKTAMSKADYKGSPMEDGGCRVVPLTAAATSSISETAI